MFPIWSSLYLASPIIVCSSLMAGVPYYRVYWLFLLLLLSIMGVPYYLVFPSTTLITWCSLLLYFCSRSSPFTWLSALCAVTWALVYVLIVRHGCSLSLVDVCYWAFRNLFLVFVHVHSFFCLSWLVSSIPLMTFPLFYLVFPIVLLGVSYYFTWCSLFVVCLFTCGYIHIVVCVVYLSLESWFMSSLHIYWWDNKS